jgi:uncharacterized protein
MKSTDYLHYAEEFSRVIESRNELARDLSLILERIYQEGGVPANVDVVKLAKSVEQEIDICSGLSREASEALVRLEECLQVEGWWGKKVVRSYIKRIGAAQANAEMNLKNLKTMSAPLQEIKAEQRKKEKLKIKPSVAKKKPAAKKVVAKKKPAAKKKLEATPTPIVNETAEPLIKAAEQGDGTAQCKLGAAYAMGEGITQDYKEAVKWYRAAAEQGLAEAQYNLGLLYESGTGVAQDDVEAAKWYRLAAEQGDVNGQFSLGCMYIRGNGVIQDYKEAAEWIQLAAEQGLAGAQFNFGLMYINGKGAVQDYEEAAKWFRLAAEQGLAEAQYNLGTMCAEGKDITRDYKEAVKWYRAAAEQGMAEAQYSLGVMYEKGKGVIQDYKEAEKWYRKAAEQGNLNAQFNLGCVFHAVTEDYEEAAHWYRKAAKQGYASAQHNLGVMYEKGEGVIQDYKEAEKWYRAAAEQGDTDAQKGLGLMYEKGQGVLQNFILAHMWYNIAASKGDKSAIKYRDILTSQMTPAQIAEAQKMAQDWTKNDDETDDETDDEIDDETDDETLNKCFSMLGTEYVLHNIRTAIVDGRSNSFQESEWILRDFSSGEGERFDLVCTQHCIPQRIYHFEVLKKYKSKKDNHIFYFLLYQSTKIKEHKYKFAFEEYPDDVKKRRIYIYEDPRTINDPNYAIHQDMSITLSKMRLARELMTNEGDILNQLLEKCYSRIKSVYESNKMIIK